MIIFFLYLRPHFENIFVLGFFIMFSVLTFRMEHKKAIENRTTVYFCLHYELLKNLSILGHFCCFRDKFLICLQYFPGVQYVQKDVIHTVILKKSNIFILREFCKRTHCPLIVTLALLLFVPSGYTSGCTRDPLPTLDHL